MNFEELVIKNQTAVIFDGNDELNIYSTISELFDKKEFARNLAKNSQEHIRKNYSVSTMIEKLIDVYRQNNANNS
jgi:glycosyltransferase involved in cell wall biosynthesis